MATYKGSSIAVLGMIIGIALTVTGWFMISGVASVMPIALLTALFWIGFVLNWSLAVLVSPVMMITKGVGSWKNSIKGMMYFFGATIGAVLSYYIIPHIIEMLPLSDGIGSISWFLLILFWVAIMIIWPSYIITKEYIR